MLHELDDTLFQLLQSELPFKNVQITFEPPIRDQVKDFKLPTINLFLYDVRENATLRQHAWERQLSPASGSGKNGTLVQLKRTPLRMDCEYLITVWGESPRDEHLLLTHCLLILSRFPILSKDRLLGSLKNAVFDVQTAIARHDKLTNPTEIWSVLDIDMRLGISFSVTLALDPWTTKEGFQEFPMVKTRQLQLGQGNTGQDVSKGNGKGQANIRPIAWVTNGQKESNKQPLTRIEKEELDAMFTIGGTVYERETQEPVAGTKVTLEELGLVAVTDAQGRFVLGSMVADRYTIVAIKPDGSKIERSVSVPTSSEQEYDLVV